MLYIWTLTVIFDRLYPLSLCARNFSYLLSLLFFITSNFESVNPLVLHMSWIRHCGQFRFTISYENSKLVEFRVSGTSANRKVSIFTGQHNADKPGNKSVLQAGFEPVIWEHDNYISQLKHSIVRMKFNHSGTHSVHRCVGQAGCEDLPILRWRWSVIQRRLQGQPQRRKLCLLKLVSHDFTEMHTRIVSVVI
jgi:hypothetical protein